MVALPGGEIMLSLDGQTQVFGASKGTAYGSLPAPTFAPQLNDILVQSSCVGCAGKDGRAMKRVLHWGALPAALAFSLPHVLAMLPSSIEARLQPSVLIKPAD